MLKHHIDKINAFMGSESFRIYAWCCGVVIIWRVLLEIVNHSVVKFGTSIVPLVPNVNFGLDRWTAWDGKWYLSIIREGYFLDYSRETASNIPFFPGFPIIIDSLSSISRLPAVYVGLALNTLLTTFCVYFLYQITRMLAEKMGEDSANHALASRLSVVLFLAFPSSLFLAAFYAEAILIFGISGAIFFALRNQLLVAALFAGIASSTKSIGVAVLPAILILHYQQHARSFIDIQVLRRYLGTYVVTSIIGLSGLLLYMLYLLISFGDPLLFSSLQKLWLREVTPDFLTRLWEIYYRNTFVPAYFEGTFNYIITLMAMYGPILAIILSVLFAKLYKFYWLLPMVIITILLPASTAIMQSMNRYIFSFVALYAIMAVLLVRSRSMLLTFGVLAVFSTLLIYSTAGFLLGSYFAG